MARGTSPTKRCVAVEGEVLALANRVENDSALKLHENVCGQASAKPAPEFLYRRLDMEQKGLWVAFYKRKDDVDWQIWDAFYTRRHALDEIARCKVSHKKEDEDSFEYALHKYIIAEIA